MEPLRPGDGDLNVRSVIDPLLLFRSSPPLPTPPLVLLPITLLLIELCDPRRDMRFVWILPTGSGEVVCDRRAAAAAAEESELCELLRFKKAELAAVAAAAEVLLSTGCAYLLARFLDRKPLNGPIRSSLAHPLPLYVMVARNGSAGMPDLPHHHCFQAQFPRAKYVPCAPSCLAVAKTCWACWP